MTARTPQVFQGLRWSYVICSFSFMRYLQDLFNRFSPRLVFHLPVYTQGISTIKPFLSYLGLSPPVNCNMFGDISTEAFLTFSFKLTLYTSLRLQLILFICFVMVPKKSSLGVHDTFIMATEM